MNWWGWSCLRWQTLHPVSQQENPLLSEVCCMSLKLFFLTRLQAPTLFKGQSVCRKSNKMFIPFCFLSLNQHEKIIATFSSGLAYLVIVGLFILSLH